jgi:hypothetical protein
MNKVATWAIAAAMTGIGSAAMAQETQFNIMGTFYGGGTFSGELMFSSLTTDHEPPGFASGGSFDSGMITVAGLPTATSSLDGVYVKGRTLQFPDINIALVNTGPVQATFRLFLGILPLQGSLPLGVSFNDNETTDISAPQTGLGVSFLSGTISVAAPEIDAASAASGLTLLLGGLMVLRGRRSGVVAAV